MAVVVQQCFEHGYPIFLLRHPGRPIVPDLPSWVPDFTYPPSQFELEPRRLTAGRHSQQFDARSLCKSTLTIGRMVYEKYRNQFTACFSPDSIMFLPKNGPFLTEFLLVLSRPDKCRARRRSCCFDRTLPRICAPSTRLHRRN